MEKQKADLLVYDGIIITMDDADQVLSDDAIAIKDSMILEIGLKADLVEKYDFLDTLDASDHIILPGMVDTHFHTGQQFERNLISHLIKRNALRDPIWQYALIPFEAALSDEDVHLSAQLAYANMLKVGTTCFSDAGGPRPELMAPAIEETGIRGILVRSTLDETRDIPIEMQDTIEGVVEKGENLYKNWNGKANGRIRAWMGMREIMVCSSELIMAIKETADRLNTGIHIHLAEQPSEVDHAIRVSGMRPAHYLESLGFLAPNVHAAHSALLSRSELDVYEEYDISVGHCPSVAFMALGPTKVPEMLWRGLRVGIGSDGAMASGGSLDLFRQIAVTRAAQSVAFGLPYHNGVDFISDMDLLGMATRGGAQALQWDDEIGSIAGGKKADMILIGLNDLEIMPMYDPIHCAASVAHGHHVQTVIVNGEVVMKDRVLQKIDEEALKAKIKERTPKILENFLDKAVE